MQQSNQGKNKNISKYIKNMLWLVQFEQFQVYLYFVTKKKILTVLHLFWFDCSYFLCTVFSMYF